MSIAEAVVFSAIHEQVATKAGWTVFNAGGPDASLQRIDFPDDGSDPRFSSDTAAWLHVYNLVHTNGCDDAVVDAEEVTAAVAALGHLQEFNPVEYRLIFEAAMEA